MLQNSEKRRKKQIRELKRPDGKQKTHRDGWKRLRSEQLNWKSKIEF
jgi:hypothetical protein